MARIPISEIKAGLNSRAEEFCSRYLAGGRIDPGNKTHWKVGNIQGDAPKGEHGGSTIVDLSGPRVGQWHDFSTGEHGDLLDVLQERFGKDYLKEAKSFLGIGDEPRSLPAPAGYTEQARKMWKDAGAIEGTSAEGYLRGRGINLDPWPACFRYVGKARIKFAEDPDGKGAKKHAPVLLCRVDGADGELAGIQRVFLDPDNPAKKYPDPRHAKKSLGPVKGGAIRLTGANRILGICEGPEKGAALVMMALANGMFDDFELGIWAVPGVSMLPETQLPPEVEEVWILADMDPPDSQGRRPGQDGAQKAADRFLAAGKRVKVVFPPREGEDWDDLMNRLGLELAGELLRRLIEKAHLNEPGNRPDDLESEPYMNGGVEGYEGPLGDQTTVHDYAPQAEPPPEPESGDPGPEPDKVVRWVGLPDLQERYVWLSAMELWHDKEKDELMKESSLDKSLAHCFNGKASKALLAHPDTLKVDRVTFAPGQPNDRPIREGKKLCWNLWIPPQTVPRQGDIALFLKHLRYLCDNNETAERYMLDWIAFQVQNPGAKIKSSPVLIGTQGTGKSFMTEVMRILLGEHNVVEISPEVFENRFNSWLTRAQLVVFEEMRVDDKWKMMNKLKPLITNLRLNIELKGVDIFSIPNRANWLFLSNDIVGAVIERGDRRYMVIASQAEAETPEYYDVLFGWLHGPGGPALMHYFKNVHDCAEFNPNAHAPETDAKRLVQELSKDQVTRDIQDLWETRTWPFNCDVVLPRDVLSQIGDKHRPTLRAVEIFLHRLGAWHFDNPVRLDSDRRGRPWIVNRQPFWRANLDANREQFLQMLKSAYQKGRNHGNQGITGEDAGALPWGDEYGPH